MVLFEDFDVFRKEVGTVYYFSRVRLALQSRLAGLLWHLDEPFVILVVICRELLSTLD